MKCDELKKQKYCQKLAFGDEAYLAKQADEAIKELKEEVNNLLMQNMELCQALQVMYSAEEYTKLQDENAELKAKLENVQASMYCDVVDANMENRRLKRALWIARAYRAEARKNYWYARCHEGDERLWSIDGSAVKYIGCIKRTYYDWLLTWSEVESKCLKKAEEYK